MSIFSTRLKELRREANISQQDLSKIIGISKSSVNMYERGEREPGLETVKTLAEYFNVKTDYLLGKTDIKRGFKIGYRSNKTIAQNIRSYREKAGISTKEMSILLEVTEETIFKIEQSEYKLDKELIFRICDILHVTPDLLDGVIIERLEQGDIDAEYCYTRFPNNATNTPFLSPANEKESQVLFAYRSHLEMQPAVDKLLGIEESKKNTVYTVYNAANSPANHEGIIKMDAERWHQMEDTPKTDDDLL